MGRTTYFPARKSQTAQPDTAVPDDTMSIFYRETSGYAFEELSQLLQRADRFNISGNDYVGSPTANTELNLKLGFLEAVIRSMETRMAEMQEQLASRPIGHATILHHINSETYQLLVPISVIIEEYEDDVYVAWPEAGISASGPTISDAILELKETILEELEFLNTLADAEMGEKAANTKRLLNIHIAKPK